jgi:hypothetical protein
METKSRKANGGKAMRPKQMEQFDRVCKGLECCLHNDHKNCRYNRDDVKDTVCTTEMMSDALALIRQQQARIAELEAANASWQTFTPFLHAHGLLNETEGV